MRKFLLNFTIAAACLCAPAMATSQEGKQMTQDQLAVLATINDMTTAFHESDITGVMNAYASDATIMFEPGLPVTGDADQRAGFQRFFAVKPSFVYGQHAVIIQGDTAVHTTLWNMTGTTLDGQAIA